MTIRSGPHRSEAVRQAVLQATAELVLEAGYDNLAIEHIATRAGVAKQTIYRWWRSKGDIFAECLIEGTLLPDLLLIPDTGDTRADLRAWLTDVQTALESKHGEGLMRSIIGAGVVNADVGAAVREGLSGERSLYGRLRRDPGVQAKLAAGVAVSDLADALVGAALVRAIGRVPLRGDSLDRLLTAVLGPESRPERP